MSVYLPNGYRLAFNCDSILPESVAKEKAQAYADRTGKEFYVPNLGRFTPASTEPEPDPDPDPDPDPEPEAIKKK